MKKIIRILLILLLVGFVVIQFFQPEKNSSGNQPHHIFETQNLPGNIKASLQHACLDCHSNQTQYPWYHKIAPVSWMINKHIEEGKKELNFSDWGTFDEFDKLGVLDEIGKEVERKTMPLKSYLLMHPKAKFSEEQTKEFVEWTIALSEEMVNILNE